MSAYAYVYTLVKTSLQKSFTQTKFFESVLLFGRLWYIMLLSLHLIASFFHENARSHPKNVTKMLG